MKFRKKPVVIDAVIWTGENSKEIMDFLEEKNATCDEHGLRIHTLEGTHTALVGDFIIKGVKGEFYPCKPDIFEMTYERAGAAPNVEWNKNIRDSVDKLLEQAGYAEDSSARHQLAMMNFDSAGAAPVPQMTGAALTSQEPVAEVLLVGGEKVIDASMAFFDSVELGTKLYLAAGAAKEQA